MNKPIKNIRNATWSRIKQEKWQWLGLAGIGIGGDIVLMRLTGATFLGPFMVLPWVPLIIKVTLLRRSIRRAFWKQFAKKHNWNYQISGKLEHEEAIMIHEGHSTKLQNYVSGTLKNMPTRVFELKFTKGHGKHSTTYHYTVFGFTFNGTFPHCYLNNLHNRYGISGRGVHISLPQEFEKQFRLYGPKEYEVEVLQIFTPDVLSHLLDLKWPHDIELVDSELLIFRDHLLNSTEELEAEFQRARDLSQYLSPTLNRMQLEKIGHHPHTLTS